MKVERNFLLVVCMRLKKHIAYYRGQNYEHYNRLRRSRRGQ